EVSPALAQVRGLGGRTIVRVAYVADQRDVGSDLRLRVTSDQLVELRAELVPATALEQRRHQRPLVDRPARILESELVDRGAGDRRSIEAGLGVAGADDELRGGHEAAAVLIGLGCDRLGDPSPVRELSGVIVLGPVLPLAEFVVGPG